MQSAPEPDFHKLENLLLEKIFSTPTSDRSETVLPHIRIYQVADVVGHRWKFFPLTGECSESLGAFWFFFKYKAKVVVWNDISLEINTCLVG